MSLPDETTVRPDHPPPVPVWQVVGSSVVGTSHLVLGRGCEDAHAFRVLDNDTVCLAVADGAGSARHAAEASRLAVDVALRECAALAAHQPDTASADVWELAMKRVIQTARSALDRLAREHEQLDAADEVPRRVMHDYATTLLIAIAWPNRVVAAQVGDGATIVSAQGALESLTVPDHGEYINEATFLTSRDYLAHTQVTVHDRSDILGVALLSDGLQFLALNMQTEKPHAPFFQPLFQFAARPDAAEPELSAFLGSPRVCARTDDDKTLVIAVRTWSATDEPTTEH